MKLEVVALQVLVLGGDEGIPLEIIHMLDACLHVPQHGVARFVNPSVATAIAVWEYTRQHQLQQPPANMIHEEQS